MSQDHFLNLQPGTIINGRYEVVKCLGTGSMGMVYACRHRELAGHMVAMKVLFAEVARDSVAAARFRNEIVASYGVSHPNVVRAYEYFRDGDLIAFTMEFIGGGDLADRINADSAIPIEETIRMLGQMCSGVQAIHDAGIIHRDLKPENILITAQGDIKITDFGIARTGTGPKLTDHGGVVGTIDYVSPEYLERGQVDARSDIYALGVLAYEMITGESPFRGQSVIETMTMRLRTDPEAPHQLRPDCPVALSNIVLKAMARDPDKRYQSAQEMLEDAATLGGIDVVQKSTPSKTKNEVVKPKSGESSANGRGMPKRSNAEAQDERLGAGQSAAATHAAQGGGSGRDFRSAEGLQSLEDRRSSSTMVIDSSVVKRPSGVGRKNSDEGVGQEGASAQLRKIELHRPGHVLDVEARAVPSISISAGKISPDRVKELFHDYQAESNDGFGSVILGWFKVIFVMVLGIGAGYFLVRHFRPDLFAASEQTQSPYLDGFQTDK